MKILLKSLKALAEGNRLRMLRLMMDQLRCVCELQAALSVANPPSPSIDIFNKWSMVLP